MFVYCVLFWTQFDAADTQFFEVCYFLGMPKSHIEQNTLAQQSHIPQHYSKQWMPQHPTVSTPSRSVMLWSVQTVLGCTTYLWYACCHSLQNPLFAILLSKNMKIKRCRTIILPVFMCGCENCSLSLMEKRPYILTLHHRVQSQDILAEKGGSDRRLEKTA